MLWLIAYESRIDYFFTIINFLSIPQRCNVVLISFISSEVVLLSPGNFILSPPLLEISVSVVICVKKNGGHWPPSSYILLCVILTFKVVKHVHVLDDSNALGSYFREILKLVKIYRLIEFHSCHIGYRFSIINKGCKSC